MGNISRSDVECKFFLLEQRIPDIENTSKKKKVIEDLIRYEIKKTNVADEDIESTSNFNLASDEQDQPEESTREEHRS